MGGIQGWAEAIVLSTGQTGCLLYEGQQHPAGGFQAPSSPGAQGGDLGPYSSWGRGTGGVHMGPAGSPHKSSSLALGTNGWLQSQSGAAP